METYHKIQTLFKRHLDGPNKGKMIRGAWTTPALEYLASNQWEFTEKVDGTNIRIELVRAGDVLFVELGGRTDNAVIPKHLLEHLEMVFPNHPTNRRDLGMPSYADRNKQLHRWMESKGLDRVLLFGEGYGPKIQNGGLYRDHPDFVLFDVNIGGFWLDRDNVFDIANQLDIDAVPVLGYGTLNDAIEIVTSGLTWDSNGLMRKWHGGSVKKGLRSTWGDFEAEGIVARPMTPLFDRKGDRIITKIKAVDFR